MRYRRRGVLGVCACTVFGAAVLLQLGCSGGANSEEPGGQDTGSGPVVLVGFDGLDWVLLDRLIAAGRCPTFASMKSEGAWAQLVSHRPVLSPLIWTSIATGRRPEVHGVLDFLVRDPSSGATVPVSSWHRRVPAFWNVLSDNGRSVHVVNWWATHPVEEINGVMVSERPFYQLAEMGEQRLDETDVYPAMYRGEVRRRVLRAESIGIEELASYVEMSRGEIENRLAQAPAADNPFDDRLFHLRTILATTHSVFELGRWLLAEHPADLTALYVEGTDTVGHRFAPFLPPKLRWVDDVEYQAFEHTMARYYELCDRELGQLMDRAPDDTTWIVTADHGFFTGSARPSVPADDFDQGGAAQWHRMVGVFMAQGPNVRPGRIRHLDVYDLCRSLLWLLDVPISDELEGTEAEDLMTPSWAEAHPPARVASFGPRRVEGTVAPEGASPVDEARLLQLQALGYVDPSVGDHPTTGSQAISATTMVNRAVLAKERGDFAEALRLLEETVDAEPGYYPALLELSEIHWRQGDHRLALAWLCRAMQTDAPGLPDYVPMAFARLSILTGKARGALPILWQMPARWQATATHRAAVGYILTALDRPQEARQAFEEALRLDAGSLEAVEGLAALASEGLDTGWERRLDPAFTALRTDLDGLRRLARLCVRHDQHRAGERCLHEVVKSDPTDHDALLQLARLMHRLGEHEQALEMARRSVSVGPDDPEARRLLRVLERSS